MLIQELILKQIVDFERVSEIYTVIILTVIYFLWLICCESDRVVILKGINFREHLTSQVEKCYISRRKFSSLFKSYI